MAKKGNQLRIIGGEWRGRKLPFADVEGLRPTPDRVRETLFNWLQNTLPAARCLDLFAGSGALGLEAASRGARQVVLVERERRVAQQLRSNLETLKATGVEVVEGEALTFLARPAQPFDVVFLDPPFRAGLLAPCCTALESGGWLAPGARIYLEAEAEAGTPQLPANWTLARSKLAGQVGYHLAIRNE